MNLHKKNCHNLAFAGADKYFSLVQERIFDNTYSMLDNVLFPLNDNIEMTRTVFEKLREALLTNNRTSKHSFKVTCQSRDLEKNFDKLLNQTRLLRTALNDLMISTRYNL